MNSEYIGTPCELLTSLEYVLTDYYGSEISTTNIVNNHANYKNSSFAPPTIDFAWADQRDRASELGAVRR